MSSTVQTGIDVHPFQVEIPNEVLDDLRRRIADVIYFNDVDKGGHFAAWEGPEIFSSELREAVRSLR